MLVWAQAVPAGQTSTDSQAAADVSLQEEEPAEVGDNAATGLSGNERY